MRCGRLLPLVLRPSGARTWARSRPGCEPTWCCSTSTTGPTSRSTASARQVVYGETGRGLRHVLVDGRLVVRDGVFTTVDEAALRAEIAELMGGFRPTSTRTRPAWRLRYRTCSTRWSRSATSTSAPPGCSTSSGDDGQGARGVAGTPRRASWPGGRGSTRLTRVVTASQAPLRLADRYLLDGLLGTGSTAEVYLGLDQVLGRRVAVKIFRPDWSSTTRHGWRRRGARSAALNHPGLVAVYDAGAAQLAMASRATCSWSLWTAPAWRPRCRRLRSRRPSPRCWELSLPTRLPMSTRQGVDAPRHQAGQHPDGPRQARRRSPTSASPGSSTVRAAPPPG